MPITQACELATEKSRSWIALVTIGGAILLSIIVLALVGLAFGVSDVTWFLLTLHNTSVLYLMVVAGVIMITMGLYQRNVKHAFCGIPQ